MKKGGKKEAFDPLGREVPEGVKVSSRCASLGSNTIMAIKHSLHLVHPVMSMIPDAVLLEALS